MHFRDWELQALDLLGEPLDDVQRFFFVSRYFDNLPAHLCLYLRHARRLTPADLPGVADAWESGQLTQGEWDDVHDIDVVVAGTPVSAAATQELHMAIQLELRVDLPAVEDIARRVNLLRKCGATVRAAVDGRFITPDAQRLAEQLGVTVLVSKAAPAA
ncbi:MAG: hypothetical protein IT301_05740 [Dehalococcoidia bacterium]|nr:hypothetical protein [Dehalococcoidia bacterium]